ncbi:methyltransferase domain-containing protein [Halobacteria archaeon AArc-m2/3/4]|uniref:Methyltransferase domain-containing protein n=1 Tax=Natronoglomus mannanivorans TaxID=2979990 RepID=A0ABT2QIM5_9EURY|nr:methyltransferase domain-containing protein [Halobacteria archaeon AArc-m2/3/4]
MEEVVQTRNAYESEAEAYVEKYCSISAVDIYGDTFLEVLADGQSDEPSRLLDLGCGPGSDIETFNAAGYEVVGLDITQSFLRKATGNALVADFVCGDMRNLPFSGESFEGIWASASLHHIPRSDIKATLRDCQRILRSGGSLCASVKHDVQPEDDTERHFEYYTVEEFQSVLNNTGFDVRTAETRGGWTVVIATC